MEQGTFKVYRNGVQLRKNETGGTGEGVENDNDFESGEDYQEHNESNERKMNTIEELQELLVVDLLGVCLLTFDFESMLHFIESGYIVFCEALLTTLLIVYTFFKIVKIARSEIRNVKNKQK